MKDFFDRKLAKFLLVGLLNTALGAALMFGFYNLAGLGYWGATALSNTLAGVMSFVLNRRFTFQASDTPVASGFRFAANIGLCYFVAYSVAKPLASRALMMLGLRFSQHFAEQFSMLCGMALFTALNYIGQRYFVFRRQNA